MLYLAYRPFLMLLKMISIVTSNDHRGLLFHSIQHSICNGRNAVAGFYTHNLTLLIKINDLKSDLMYDLRSQRSLKVMISLFNSLHYTNGPRLYLASRTQFRTFSLQEQQQLSADIDLRLHCR